MLFNLQADELVKKAFENCADRMLVDDKIIQALRYAHYALAVVADIKTGLQRSMN